MTDDDSQPLPKRANGDDPASRDPSGRFVKGHRMPGPGNPHAIAVAKLRAALLAAVTPDDLTAIIAALVRKARDGDVIAAREILDRTIGQSLGTLDLVLRIEQLEKETTDEPFDYEPLDRDEPTNPHGNS